VPSVLDTGLTRFMKRILLFDLLYLKEFKQATFKSDFDELQFAISLILDVNRALVDRDSSLASI
jgi:hypothetical protein